MIVDVLWVSNAPWTSSGYGNQTALTVPRIAAAGHDVSLSCFYGLEGGMINWNGIRCFPTDETRFGTNMLGDYAHIAGRGDRQSVKVFTLMDVWVMLPHLEKLTGLEFVCWTPFHLDPLPPGIQHFLHGVQARAIGMSKWGQAQLQESGLDAMYAPHAIDTNVFRPRSPDERRQIRDALKVPADAFVVGMVGVNQGIPSRKAFPEVFDAFAEFRRRHDDALLFLHTDMFGTQRGLQLLPLAEHTGIPRDAILHTDQTAYRMGLPVHEVAQVMGMFDVLAMPSYGEGFGIPLIESQASGVPVITTDWTAMTELCGSGWLVDGERIYDGTQGSFMKKPNVGEIVDALEEAYAVRGSEKVARKAREFAVGYDIEKVFAECWMPILAEVEKPREVAPLRLVA